MQTVSRNSSSLAVPLITEDNIQETEDKLEDLEPNFTHQRTKTTATSFFKTCFHGLNALSGVGILSIPYALGSGGWLSLMLLFVIAGVALYSGLLMKRCMEVESNIRTYPDIGQRAFGNKGRLLVSIIMYVELYLVSIGFLILEGDNLQILFTSLKEFQIGGLPIAGKQGLTVLAALVILPSVWIDNLSLLSYISASGVVASVVLLGSIVWTGAFDGIGFHQKGDIINWTGIPIAVSLYAFCYCAHPVFPTLYTAMKNKHQFSNVLLVCFVLCTLSYASMAILGYLMFGSSIQSQITLNLSTGTLSERVAIYTTLVNPIAKYALMITPIVNSIKTSLPRHYNKRTCGLIISTALVTSTTVIAVVVPFFGSLMSLVGAFLSINASIILPCLCYLKISGSYRRLSCEVIVIGGIVLMSVVVMVFGTYTSIVDIVRNL